jgi:Zn-dependent protease
MDLQKGLQDLSIQFVPFMMAVVFHEFAHGLVAHRYGDDTAKEMGRLTLNPAPHIDVLGTLVFPILMMVTGMHLLFGWARPVPIDPTRFKKYRPALFWVSFAGPAMNFFLALLSGAAFAAIRAWVPEDFYLFEPLLAMAVASVTINYALGIFNLIPLPPLDGSKMIQSFLSLEATRKYEAIAQYSFFILLALMWTGALSVLSYPIVFARNLTLFGASRLFGLPDLL